MKVALNSGVVPMLLAGYPKALACNYYPPSWYVEVATLYPVCVVLVTFT